MHIYYCGILTQVRVVNYTFYTIQLIKLHGWYMLI